jgi:hypothetical protein
MNFLGVLDLYPGIISTAIPVRMSTNESVAIYMMSSGLEVKSNWNLLLTEICRCNLLHSKSPTDSDTPNSIFPKYQELQRPSKTTERLLPETGLDAPCSLISNFLPFRDDRNGKRHATLLVGAFVSKPHDRDQPVKLNQFARSLAPSSVKLVQ